MALKRITEYKPDKQAEIPRDESFDQTVNAIADQARLTAPKKEEKKPKQKMKLKNIRIPVYLEKAFLNYQYEQYQKNGTRITFTDLIVDFLSKELRSYID